MDAFGKLVIFFILQCYIYSILAASVSNTCNKNEYLYVETNQCLVCSVCYDLGLVSWVPCTTHSDTVCGPQWTILPKQGSVMPEQTANDLIDHHTLKVADKVFIGLLIGLGLSVCLVSVITCLLLRRRREDSVYRGDVKSLQEIANERCNAAENANMYVHVEALLNAK